MDYEKKYKDALERARQFSEHPLQEDSSNIVEYIFPELRESKDEKIRQKFIKLVIMSNEVGGFALHKWEADEMLAWLEKQGKQKPKDRYTFKSIPRLLEMIKPTDKAKAYCQKLINTLAKEGYNIDAKIVEEVLKGWNDEDVPMAVMDKQKPTNNTKLSEEEQNKFAKGVLISCALSFINYLDAHKYEGKMCVSNGECEDIENAFRNAMWDRLHRYYCKYIKKQGESYTKRDVDDAFVEGMVYAKSELEKQGGIDNCPLECSTNTVMTDSNKKELKEIKKNTDVGHEYFSDLLEKYDCGNIDDYAYQCAYCMSHDWLKDTPTWDDVETACKLGAEWSEKHHKSAWSEEDMKEALRTEYEKGRADTIAEMKKDWSEDDEKILDAIIDFFENGTVKLQHDLSLYASWLKSLKQRYAWKPSNEQMNTLNLVVSDYYHACTKESDKKVIVLKSILEQLKQL